MFSDWKYSPEGIHSVTIQKQQFPPLLNKMLQVLSPNVADNLKSGFRKCGIYPVNVEELLNRIPRNTCNQNEVHSVFLKNLEARRSDSTKVVQTRRKKMNVPAGKSVCIEAEDSNDDTSLLAVLAEPTSSFKSKKKPFSDMFSDDSTDDIDFDEIIKELEKEQEFVDYIDRETSAKEKQFSHVVREVGQFVAFTYEGEIFPGEIVSFTDEQVTINAMQKSLKAWKWPQKLYQIAYSWDDVLGSIKPPVQVSNRGFFDVPELKVWWS